MRAVPCSAQKRTPMRVKRCRSSEFWYKVMNKSRLLQAGCGTLVFVSLLQSLGHSLQQALA